MITSRNALTNRRLLTAGAIAATLALTGCGLEDKIVEEGAERIIEAETGEDVELDVDHDGGFSIQTEEGGISFDEDGSFVATDAAGSVFSGEVNGDGLTVTNQDGEQVIDVDSNGDTAELTISGEDGEKIFRTVTEIPAEWPSDVPRPAGLAVEAGFYERDGGQAFFSLAGSPTGSGVDFANAYVAALASAGFTETGRFDGNSDGEVTAQRTMENAQWTLNVNGFTDDSTSYANLVLMSKGS